MKPRVRVHSWEGASWYEWEGKVYRNESKWPASDWKELLYWEVPFVLY